VRSSLFPEVTGSTTIYLVPDKASTLDIVGVSSTPVDNFCPFSTGLWRDHLPSKTTISLTTDTKGKGVE
jgi:hypothetical protein